MAKIVAVHSYKGGTGKTSMSVSLAATLAKGGKKVCVFDLGLSGAEFVCDTKSAKRRVVT
jgi:MinD-like ATPase involved in chromosome partitioning or flagellar assembly